MACLLARTVKGPALLACLAALGCAEDAATSGRNGGRGGSTSTSGGSTSTTPNGGSTSGNGGATTTSTAGTTSGGGTRSTPTVNDDAAAPDTQNVGSCGSRSSRDYGGRFTTPEPPDASVPPLPSDAGVGDDGGAPDPVPTTAPGGWPMAMENGLSLQVLPKDSQPAEINLDFGMRNQTGDEISLGDVVFRFYYAAGFLPVVDVDYAAITQPSHQPINVTSTVTPHYVEFSFGGEEDFPNGGVLTIQTRMHSANYQDAFDKCDSFSFDDADTSLADYEYVPVFYQDELVWGVEPVLAP